VLDVTDQINDPKQNVIDQSVGDGGLMMAYAQSFLGEEVGKMYRGELVLRGIPEIEPADVLLITRSSRPALQQKPRAHAQDRIRPPATRPSGSRAHLRRSVPALLPAFVRLSGSIVVAVHGTAGWMEKNPIAGLSRRSPGCSARLFLLWATVPSIYRGRSYGPAPGS